MDQTKVEFLLTKGNSWISKKIFCNVQRIYIGWSILILYLFKIQKKPMSLGMTVKRCLKLSTMRNMAIKFLSRPNFLNVWSNWLP